MHETSQDRQTEMKCSVCSKETTSTCGKCGSVGYCCKTHQAGDWTRHRYECMLSCQKLPARELGRVCYTCFCEGLEVAAGANSTQLKMRSTKSIKAGELMVLEHIIEQSEGVVIAMLKSNKDLFNALAPRDTKWDKFPDKLKQRTIKYAAQSKASTNEFESSKENATLLGITVSYFNHSCHPNAVYAAYRAHGLVFQLVTALRDIASGDEVCVNYGPFAGHSTNPPHNWTCDCGMSFEEREKQCLDADIAMYDIFAAIKDEIDALIGVYYATETCRYIAVTHELARRGMRVNSDLTASYSRQFAEKLKSQFPDACFEKACKLFKERITDDFECNRDIAVTDL